MGQHSPTGRPPPRRLPPLVGLLVGGLVGFAVGAVLYLVLAAALDARGGVVEEFQGLAWNLVPLSTVGGAVLGAWVANRRRR